MSDYQTEVNSEHGREHIYCVRMSAIGDVVMLGRPLLALNEAGFEVVLVTSPMMLPVVKHFRFLTQVITIKLSSKENTNATEMKRYRRASETDDWYEIEKLSSDFGDNPSQGAYPLLVDFHKTSRSRKAIVELHKQGMQFRYGLSTSKRSLTRIGLLAGARLRTFTSIPSNKQKEFIKTKISPKTHVNFSQIKCISAAAGISVEDWASQSFEHNPKLINEVPAEGTPKHDVILFPGASLPLKKWPLEQASVFVQQLESHGIDVAVLGGPGETDYANELAKNTNITSYVGLKNLDESIELIKAASAVVTTDSFPVHVCDLLNKPCIALFGATTPLFGFAPLAPRVLTKYSGLSCSPCTRHGKGSCRFKNNKCMQEHSGQELAGQMVSYFRALAVQG